MPRKNYQGQLLAAPPRRRNLYLRHSVVLVAEHTPSGAWGLQINFAHSHVENLGQIILNQGIDCGDLPYPVYFGGQHHHNRCFILHSNDWSSETTMKITDEIYLSADLFILSALADHQGPREIRAIVGLHQWNRLELDQEIDQDLDYGWLACRADPQLIFQQSGEEQWESAVTLATRSRVDEFLA